MDDAVGIVIPAYQPALPTLLEYVEALRDAVDPQTIHIELDDPTPGLAEELRDAGLSVYVAPGRRGKGAAITHGFEVLDTDILAFVDADGSTTAPAMAEVIEAVETAPIAVGSRRHPGATIDSHQSLVRRRFGDVFAAVARRLLGLEVHDVQCGAKAMRADAWQRIRSHVYESGFAWDVEVLAVARALDIEVVEVPITWVDDPASTVDPVWTTLDMFRALLSVRHRTMALRGSRLHRLTRRQSRDPLIVTHAERK
jgi:glycosyltransferase involved in cell wall biosynthesis